MLILAIVAGGQQGQPSPASGGLAPGRLYEASLAKSQQTARSSKGDLANPRIGWSPTIEEAGNHKGRREKKKRKQNI